jgi:hypothetical protein
MQDDFILVQDGIRDLKLDGVWVKPGTAIWCACCAAFPRRFQAGRVCCAGSIAGGIMHRCDQKGVVRHGLGGDGGRSSAVSKTWERVTRF